MQYRRFRKPSKPAIFAMLMAGAAALMLMPRDFLAPARSMTQLMAVPQYLVSKGAKGIAKSAKGLRAEPVPAAQHAEVVKAKQAAENENVTLRQQVSLLYARVHELERLRNRSEFPRDGRLIPARVVGWDAAAGRDSMVLLKGGSHEAHKGDWVTSHLMIEAGTQDGLRDDLRVLARETLIGWVEQTASYASRVVLLSDRYANRAWRVRIFAVGREKRPDEFVMVRDDEPADFALEGIGDGKMRILDISARFVNEGRIREGDWATTDEHDPKLPLAMPIGQIIKLEPDKSQPLLYHAIVRHRCEPKELADVFIVDIPR